MIKKNSIERLKRQGLDFFFLFIFLRKETSPQDTVRERTHNCVCMCVCGHFASKYRSFIVPKTFHLKWDKLNSHIISVSVFLFQIKSIKIILLKMND